MSGRSSVDSVARRADRKRVERLFDLVEQAILSRARRAPDVLQPGRRRRFPRR